MATTAADSIDELRAKNIDLNGRLTSLEDKFKALEQPIAIRQRRQVTENLLTVFSCAVCKLIPRVLADMMVCATCGTMACAPCVVQWTVSRRGLRDGDRDDEELESEEESGRAQRDRSCPTCQAMRPEDKWQRMPKWPSLQTCMD